MTQSVIQDVVRMGGGVNEIRALYGIAGEEKSGSTSAGNQPTHSLLQKLRTGASPTCTLPTELCVFRRADADLKLSDLPNGHWTWIERAEPAATPSWYTTKETVSASMSRSRHLHRHSLALACVRVHDATLSMRRLHVNECAGVRTTVSRCGGDAVILNPEKQHMDIFSPCTFSKLGSVSLADAGDNTFLSRSPQFTDRFMYIAQSSVTETGQRKLSVHARPLVEDAGEAFTVDAVPWKDEEDGWLDLMPSEEKHIVIPSGAQLLTRRSAHFLVVFVNAATSPSPSVYFIPLHALHPKGPRTAVMARKLVLKECGAVLDAFVGLDDGDSGHNVRLTVIASTTFSPEDVVSGGDELRGGGSVDASCDWPSTDQAPSDGGCNLLSVVCDPLVPDADGNATARVTSCKGPRGSVACDVASVLPSQRLFVMSQGTWPELDTVKLAAAKGIQEKQLPARQRACVYALGSATGRMLEDRWECDTATWLSNMCVIPHKSQPDRSIVLLCGVRLDAETGEAVSELYVFDGEKLSSGPAFVVRADCDAPALALGWGSSKAVWIPAN